MKIARTLVVAMLLFQTKSTAQQAILPIDTTTGMVRYEAVIEAASSPMDKLFDRTKSWLTQKFIDLDLELSNRTDDRIAGMLSGTGTFQIPWKLAMISRGGRGRDTMYSDMIAPCTFKYRIYIKDNKSKIIATDFIVGGDIGATIDKFYVNTSQQQPKDVTGYMLWREQQDVIFAINAVARYWIRQYKDLLQNKVPDESKF